MKKIASCIFLFASLFTYGQNSDLTMFYSKKKSIQIITPCIIKSLNSKMILYKSINDQLLLSDFHSKKIKNSEVYSMDLDLMPRDTISFSEFKWIQVDTRSINNVRRNNLLTLSYASIFASSLVGFLILPEDATIKESIKVGLPLFISGVTFMLAKNKRIKSKKYNLVQ